MKNKALQNQLFSRFQIDWATRGQDHISVFGIPKSKEAVFIQNPRLAYKSLDAKELYSVPTSEYVANPRFHDAQIEMQFDQYASHMMQLMGCTE